MMALEVVQKLSDGFDKQANAPQVAHIGLDMNGVNALMLKIHLKHIGKLLADCVKQLLLQPLFR